MTSLPASIEAYLTDAGFSLTELTVMKKLLEGEAMTLRELAAKTGKSTGVLDQAVKKLLQRRIIVRETVNDSPRLLLQSLDAILTWMKEDTESKLVLMKSKARDFESFIASLKREKARPEMEFFERREGIERAYRRLLTLKAKEILRYRPVTTREEDDPLAAFRVQFFRERYRGGIFERVLAPETSLGRRFQSRDPFEYRKTVLLPEDLYPTGFEKIIAGDSVLCFNFAEEQACLLRFPELAEAERKMFEVLWRQPTERKLTAALLEPQPPEIGLGTKTFSSLREFLVSRKSVVLFGLCGLLAVAVTYGLWRHSYYLNLQRVREKAMAVAATAALQFDAEDLDQLHTKADIVKPEYRKVIEKLREIRSQNEGVTYMYILRPTKNPKIYEFVADADSLDPNAKIDLNHDGIIDDADHLSPPGESLDMSNSDWYLDALNHPLADTIPTIDQWGSWISGSAPIKDPSGMAIATIGADIEAGDINMLTRQSFSPFFIFLGLFFLFVLIRLAAFNRSLFFELIKLLKSRAILTTLAICALIALGVTYGMYRYTLNLMKEQVGERLMAIASTAAAEVDARDLEQLHWARDMKTEAYQRVFRKLNEIRDRNENVQWAYILRPTGDSMMWEFVADADANYSLPFIDPIDWNKDGVIDEADENVAPGVRYDASGQNLVRYGLKKPIYEDRLITDQWGIHVTASAPIQDEDGVNVAVLGLDMDISSLKVLITAEFKPYFLFILCFSVLVVALISTFSFMRVLR